MTTQAHDNPIKLCREEPAFAVRLARDLLGVPIPAHSEVHAYSESGTDSEVRDLNADNVVLCREGEENRFGIIVEVQRGKDERKRFSWPAYQVNIRHRLTAPVALIVVCQQPAVAAWAAEAIELGHPGFTFRPLVLGPRNYPKLTEPSGSGELAEEMVLGTLIHEHAEEIEQLFAAVNAELALVPPEKAKRYTEYMLGQLSEQPRRILEALMEQDTYPYQSELLAEREARGRAEGEANALLIIIESRGLSLSDDERRRIETCQDLNELNSWLKLAATAPSVKAIIG
ncbi:hypothetical protein [Glycomyces terrestris]|uniref:Uncharacterized protein n=1 Tax=Glycomyces terrestris TaxID=2493553 RepID=A0A426V407_9ACTN|nr:hypothetical protein [Glycomyces terrestris]RRS01644.1 hypothetical protein EIW28_02440 [Glycomyces terrestris]